jgi:hypothetical protein
LIRATRRLYPSGTCIDERLLLRLRVIPHRTHRPDVEDAVQTIRAAVAHGLPLPLIVRRQENPGST